MQILDCLAYACLFYLKIIYAFNSPKREHTSNI